MTGRRAAGRHAAPRRTILAGMLGRMAAEFAAQDRAAGYPGRSPWEPVFLAASRYAAMSPSAANEDWDAVAAAAFEGYDLVEHTDELHVAEFRREDLPGPAAAGS